MYGPILKGKKVILQPPKLSEAKRYLEWLNDDEVTRYIATFTGMTLEKEREYLKLKKKDDLLYWSVYTKSGKHIGSTGFHEVSQNHKRVLWGIMLGDKTEWGKGYGTDVLMTLLDYVFKKLKFQRFELGVFHKNIAGIKCYKKCGFKTEGIKRKYFIKGDETYDEIIMAVTDDDYKKLKRQ